MAMSPGPRPAMSYACFTAMSIAINLGCRREETIKPYSGSGGRSIGQTRLNFLPAHKQAPSALKRNYYDKDKGASQVHFVTRGLPEGGC